MQVPSCFPPVVAERTFLRGWRRGALKAGSACIYVIPSKQHTSQHCFVFPTLTCKKHYGHFFPFINANWPRAALHETRTKSYALQYVGAWGKVPGFEANRNSSSCVYTTFAFDGLYAISRPPPISVSVSTMLVISVCVFLCLECRRGLFVSNWLRTNSNENQRTSTASNRPSSLWSSSLLPSFQLAIHSFSDAFLSLPPMSL